MKKYVILITGVNSGFGKTTLDYLGKKMGMLFMAQQGIVKKT